MRKLFFAVTLSASCLCVAIFGQDDKVARGKYLVEEVAKCQDCHTPRTLEGALVKSAWLKGATLSYTPVVQTPGWHAKTPDITSASPLFTRWGDDGLVKFFETGKNPRGNAADVPMPAYTMTHDDAVAVVAFLKSLK